MSKLGADGQPVLREDGKVLKGPNYFRPNIAAILEADEHVLKASAAPTDNVVFLSVCNESAPLDRLALTELTAETAVLQEGAPFGGVT